jgi:hypothetical protein
LERKLVGRITDKYARQRLIQYTKAKYPEKTDTEIYELVIAMSAIIVDDLSLRRRRTNFWIGARDVFLNLIN